MARNGEYRESTPQNRRAQAVSRAGGTDAQRRELHEVLAHSLSQIHVQAGVGLHLMDSQPETLARRL
jgi:hypothetical protein